MSWLRQMPGRMAGEQYHIIRGPLSFSTAKVETTVRPGETLEGTFTVYGTSGAGASGFVSSSDLLMQCETAEFAGAADEVAWCFDAGNLRSGDHVSGYFRIVSNQGEYRLPFDIRVEDEVPSTPQGTAVRSLQHLVNLAKTDWAEAVRIFYNPKFGDLLHEEQHQAGSGRDPLEDWYLWRGLSAVPGEESNFEEFLISTGKKAPIEYLPEITRIETELPSTPGENMPVYYFRLTRSGWGFTHLSVTTEGDFLVPVTQKLETSDFDPSQSTEIRYAVDVSKLHDGWNFGAVHLNGRWCGITIPVAVTAGRSSPGREWLHQREVGQITVKLMQYYEDFRAKKIRGREWLQQTGTLVDRLLQLEPDDPAAALYKVHVLISGGEQKEAAWSLMDFDRRVEEALHIPSYSDPEHRALRREDPDLYAYRVYLGVLCAEDESRLTAYDASERVAEELNRAPGDWRLAWILIYLSEELRRRPAEKWALLQDQFARGNTSPMLYIEAYDMIRMNPAIISELDDFALQVLNYASRRNMIDESVMSQINALSARCKVYSDRLYRILTKAYNRGLLPEETLQSIVSLLLRGNRTNEDSFSWYAKGVEAELPLTRLFEYYCLSMPENYSGEIPQVVLRYFCYQCTLPWQRTALVYAYIMHHRQQYPEIYRQALPSIRSFTLTELSKEHVSRDLCYLYWHMLTNDVLTPDNAPGAVRVMFSCAVTCTQRTSALRTKTQGPDALRISVPQSEDPEIVAAILRYDSCTGEQRIPLQGGQAVFPIYGENYHLFFEDAAGGRYYSSGGGRAERLARYADKVSMLSAFDTGITDFDRYLAELPGDRFRISSFNCERFRALAGADGLRESFRAGIRRRLLQYYEDNDTVREMDSFLAGIDYRGVSVEERAEVLKYLVLHGQSERALSCVLDCGTEGADPAILLSLASSLLGEDGEPLRGEEEAAPSGAVSSDEAPSGAVPSDAGSQTDAVSGDAGKFPEFVHEVYAAGKYDERVLRFLLLHYEGLSVEMDEIRRSAARFGTDASPILPRMAVQLLYSGVILEDEEEFVSDWRAAGAQNTQVTAILAQMSHYYFVDDVPIHPKTVQRIGEFGLQGLPLFDISRMAYLRSLAGRSGEFRTDELETAKLFLSDLLAQGIIFPFYRRFAGLLPQLQDFADETLIQFKGKPGADVVLHYSVDREDGSGTEVMQEQTMKEMYDGIYVSGFLLFFGEQVRYFITDDADRRNVVESGTFGQDTRISDAGDDRFAMINRISTLTAMQHWDEAIDALEKYDRRADLTARLFGRH